MVNLNSTYRYTLKRVPRALLTVGTCFCYRPIRKDARVSTFIRRVVSIDYRNGFLVDHFGHKSLLSDRLVYICVPR